MSGPEPTEEQLARIERRVRERIDARVRLPARLATATAVVALIAGGFALAVPALQSDGSSASSAGSAAAGSSTKRAADSGTGRTTGVQCHRSAAAGSASVPGTLQGDPDASDARSVCLRALAAGTPAPSGAPAFSADARHFVVCRGSAGLEVFPAEGDTRTSKALCVRNGLQPVAG